MTPDLAVQLAVALVVVVAGGQLDSSLVLLRVFERCYYTPAAKMKPSFPDALGALRVW